jgi:hypothetical protein
MYNHSPSVDLILMRRSESSFNCYNIIGLGRWLLRNRCLPMRVEDHQTEYGRYWYEGATIVLCRGGEVRVEGNMASGMKLLSQLERTPAQPEISR